MRFQHFDSLRVFTLTAKTRSFSAAADQLNLTKGAVSYQIRQLEDQLGFALFDRLPRGIALTPKGHGLLQSAEAGFDSIERAIAALQRKDQRRLTIGLSTYFASRWLSPRLMTFMATHPDIRLRLQPTVDPRALDDEEIDLAIRWGNGDWSDVPIRQIFPCPAWPCGNAQAAALVQQLGLAQALPMLTLLSDREDSSAWSEWFAAANLGQAPETGALTIPDPNVRVQAVIDGQGIALNDDLIGDEIAAGRLFRLSDVTLEHYGYFLACRPGAEGAPVVADFAEWITSVV